MYQRDNSDGAARSSQGNPATHVDAPQVRVTVSRRCSTTWRKPMRETCFARSLPKQGAGDPRSADLVLSRVWPQRKGRAVIFDLPPIITAADLSAALGIIAASVASGELTPEEGQSVAAVLEIRRRAIELVELETRVAALEAKRYGAGT
jgi:hypothetical protein